MVPGFARVSHGLVNAAWQAHATMIRYPYLRMRGYQAANPHLANYHGIRGAALRQGLGRIVDPITGGAKVGVILEQGCGNGRHVTPVLHEFAEQVWGVDLIPPADVANCNRYVQVDSTLSSDHLAALPSQSVDIIMVVNYTGLHPTSMFAQYFSRHNDRLEPYMHPSNFPRVLKSGGFLVFSEWEARPERRHGKRSAAEVNAAFDDLYRPIELDGYVKVAQGYEPTIFSAYVAFQKRGPAG